MQTKLTRCGQSSQPATRHRHTRATECGAIADRENAWYGCAAVFVGISRQMAKSEVDEPVLGPESAGEAGFRLKSEVQRDDVDIEAAAIDARRLDAAVAAKCFHMR